MARVRWSPKMDAPELSQLAAQVALSGRKPVHLQYISGDSGVRVVIQRAGTSDGHGRPNFLHEVGRRAPAPALKEGVADQRRREAFATQVVHVARRAFLPVRTLSTARLVHRV